jgi:tRNA (mo5U34)-methyltransferase
LDAQWSFDSDTTRRYTKVRQDFAREFIEAIRRELVLRSALDVGTGVGYFAAFLHEMGFQVLAIDGREKNIREAKRRHTVIDFLTRNVEDPALPQLGCFDIVLCMGLVYHLENPFQAIRNLEQLTGKVLLVESMCLPGSDATLRLFDEGENDNQGLAYVAFYPTEACLVKMLYRAGFPFVYRFRQLPKEAQFERTLWREPSRTFLAASKRELGVADLELFHEQKGVVAIDVDPWASRVSRVRRMLKARFQQLFGLVKYARRAVSRMLSGKAA